MQGANLWQRHNPPKDQTQLSNSASAAAGTHGTHPATILMPGARAHQHLAQSQAASTGNVAILLVAGCKQSAGYSDHLRSLRAFTTKPLQPFKRHSYGAQVVYD